MCRSTTGIALRQEMDFARCSWRDRRDWIRRRRIRVRLWLRFRMRLWNWRWPRLRKWIRWLGHRVHVSRLDAGSAPLPRQQTTPRNRRTTSSPAPPAEPARCAERSFLCIWPRIAVVIQRTLSDWARVSSIAASPAIPEHVSQAHARTHRELFVTAASTDPDIGRPPPSARSTGCRLCEMYAGHAGLPMAVHRPGPRRLPVAVSWCRLEGALPGLVLPPRATGGC